MANEAAHPSDRQKEQDNTLVFSYLGLRNLIGIAGMALPFALALFPKRTSDYYGFEPSISDYFYTSRGDILVVILSVLGVFLLAYKGYTKWERRLTYIAAIGALGVAFVPTRSKCDTCDFSVHTQSGGVFGNLLGEGWHLAFAGTFLLCLAIISLKYFTRSNKSTMHVEGKLTQKGKRNIVFKVCGWIMIGCLAVLAIYFIINSISPVNLHGFPIIFTFETIAVEAFGFAWLTKGETLWPDDRSYVVKMLKGENM